MMDLLTEPYVEIEFGRVAKSTQSIQRPARPNAVPAAKMSLTGNAIKISSVI